MSCLDDSTVVRFLAGQLDDAARSRVESELGRCCHCAALVAEVMRVQHPEREDLAGDVPDDAEPERGSRYLLGGEIARGGMGTVLGAFDRRLARSIAIKRLASDDTALATRFAREIRITASLQHPGIVPVYDCGALPDGRPFYAMRHVQGATLEQAIAECRTAGERLGLIVPLLAAAEAVGYAHERGIIHRDLKPSNVLVGPFGETVVIDWGLARIDGAALDGVAGSGPACDPVTTSLGSVLGTPLYMAPEQARGEPATRRSDVYAIGAILYHTLTGHPPVAGDEVDVILERVARAEVRPLAEVAPGLPDDLVAIVERAMATAPDLRYASAGELAADLRRFQTGQLVGAYSYSRGDLARRFVRRHRVPVALAAIFTILLGAGGALGVRRVVVARTQAEAQRARADRERRGAEDMVQYLLYELREKLATVGRLDVLSGVADRVDAYYLTTAAGQAALPDAVSERAALHDLRAAVANAEGDGAASDRYLAQGLALLDEVPPTSRSNEIRAELLGSRGIRHLQMGRYAQARALFVQSVALYRLTSWALPEERRRLRLNLAHQLSGGAKAADRLDNARDAEREWDEAAAIVRQLRAESPGDQDALVRLAEIEMVVGQSRSRRGLLHDAKGPLLAALADSEALAAREPRNERFAYLLAWSCVSLAAAHYSLGEFADAQRLRERARETATAMVAIEPASAKWQTTLARAEMDLGMVAFSGADWARAARHLGAARAAYEQLVSRDPTSRDQRRAAAVTIAQLADAEAALGHTEAARSAWFAALAHLERLAASNAPEARLEWAYGLRGYAVLERRSGRIATADRLIENALRIVESTPATGDIPTHTYYRAAVLAETATSLTAHRRPAEAQQAWRRAAELLRGLAARVPMEPDWTRELRQVEAALAPPGREHLTSRSEDG